MVSISSNHAFLRRLKTLENFVFSNAFLKSESDFIVRFVSIITSSKTFKLNAYFLSLMLIF